MLALDDVRSGYGKGAAVLKGVSFAMHRGDRVAVMGRNGVGKTTLARSIMGLLKPSGGSIRLDGAEIAGLPSYRIAQSGIAYVPQGREIFADFSVLDNLRLGIVGRRGAVEDFEPVFAWFPILKERCDQRAGTMSGGQQQQLALARALVGQPRLLVLDEPSEGVQPSIVHEIAAVLVRICRESGLTVLIVEQNLEMVSRLV